ncbi:hypothetical protein ES319_A03G219700v1 [Gossypium barbadense]|uniref:Eukaryotic translation initiation factor 4B3-like n=2 Tax=Gossypium TaxID=3633 RepID=A0A5J5WIN8_GOSBA|nr:hypothetical protein ES319_A03G219700v1 [Gossypium barbadense]KAB2091813.1 hypothetical protein ES319_A03G219700v1 [Gossypium barbadense]TYH26364.1 hypothetical protein ES288_A03G246000v1 [Gossypium darwinii]
MAATASSPWGKPGAWAVDAEENEAEVERQQSGAGSSTEKLGDFPSLATAVTTTKANKKKGQTLSLSEFASKPSEPARLTREDLLALPTGPRQRSAEELDRNRLGGGFKSYGSNRYGSDGDDSSSNSRWGLNKDRETAPSRADEIGDWASAKKSTSAANGFGGGFERRGRGGGGGGFSNSQSKADEVDSWAANKNYKSAAEAPPRRFGGGFERSSFGSTQARDSPRDLDNWGKKNDESVSSAGSGGVRPKLVLQPRKAPQTEKGKKDATPADKPKGANPFGEARPREEVLKEKGKDWKEIDEKMEAAKIKETSAVAEKGGKGSFGNERVPMERSWRKNESVEAANQP